MRCIFALPLLLLLIGICAPTATPQKSGDAVYTAWIGGTTFLIATSPSGVSTTLFKRVGTGRPGGFTAAPHNDGILFLETVWWPSHLMQVHHDLRVTTLGRLPTTFTWVPSLVVDQGSDVLLLHSAGSSHGVYRRPARGGPLTTVAHNSLGARFVAPFEMLEDPATGDLLVLDWAPSLHRITPQGKVTSVRMPQPPRTLPALWGNAHADHATGKLLVTYLDSLLYVDPRTASFSTVVTIDNGGLVTLIGIDADPFRDGSYYVTGQWIGGTIPPLNLFVMHFDGKSHQATMLATYRTAASGIDDVVTWRSRSLSGLNRPVHGQTFSVRLSLPTDPGGTFAAAAALGTHPGIPVHGPRRVPLNPDGLFLLSRQAPAVFSGFDGKLSATGEAALTVRIPRVSALRGQRFHVAAVTYDATGIRTITEPFGVTVE